MMIQPGSARQYGAELQCCQGVVDPLTLLAVIGGIAGITYILRQTVINKITGRKKRSPVASVYEHAMDFLSHLYSQGESQQRSRSSSQHGDDAVHRATTNTRDGGTSPIYSCMNGVPLKF